MFYVEFVHKKMDGDEVRRQMSESFVAVTEVGGGKDARSRITHTNCKLQPSSTTSKQQVMSLLTRLNDYLNESSSIRLKKNYSSKLPQHKNQNQGSANQGVILSVFPP